jgi:hypothetical protein
MATGRSTTIRVVLALGAGFGAAVLAAIVLAILDRYLTGHGYPSVLRPWIEWPAAGVHLSVGDVVMYLAACLAGLGTWFAASGRS